MISAREIYLGTIAVLEEQKIISLSEEQLARQIAVLELRIQELKSKRDHNLNMNSLTGSFLSALAETKVSWTPLREWAREHGFGALEYRVYGNDLPRRLADAILRTQANMPLSVCGDTSSEEPIND